MIILDTSVLVAALTGEKALESELRETLREGTWIGLPTIVWYEWLRGPRLPEETAAAAVLFRPYETIPFQRPEAVVAARLYRTLSRPRGREMDFTIAACALVREAELWTLNQDDFTDIPQLRLSPPLTRRTLPPPPRISDSKASFAMMKRRVPARRAWCRLRPVKQLPHA